MSDTIGAVQDIKFARSARKHRIGRAHALHVIHTAAYTRYSPTDDCGVELEIIAVELPDLWLVIHVMPTALRRKP